MWVTRTCWSVQTSDDLFEGHWLIFLDSILWASWFAWEEWLPEFEQIRHTWLPSVSRLWVQWLHLSLNLMSSWRDELWSGIHDCHLSPDFESSDYIWVWTWCPHDATNHGVGFAWCRVKQNMLEKVVCFMSVASLEISSYWVLWFRWWALFLDLDLFCREHLMREPLSRALCSWSRRRSLQEHLQVRWTLSWWWRPGDQ